MVSGRKPITGASTSETLIKQLTWMPPLPSESAIGGRIPAALEALIMRSLAKRPEERPADLREVQRILRSILEGTQSDPLPAANGPYAVDIPNVIPNRTARHGSAVPSLEPHNHVVGIPASPGVQTRPDLAGDPAPNEARPVAAEAASGQPGAGLEKEAAGLARQDVVRQDPRVPRQGARKKSGIAFLFLGLLLVMGLLAGAGWLVLRDASEPMAEVGDGAVDDTAPAPTSPSAPGPAAAEAQPTRTPDAAAPAAAADAVNAVDSLGEGVEPPPAAEEAAPLEAGSVEDPNAPSGEGAPSMQDAKAPTKPPPASDDPGAAERSRATAEPGRSARSVTAPAPARAPSPPPASGPRPKGSASPQPAGSGTAPAPARGK